MKRCLTGLLSAGVMPWSAFTMLLIIEAGRWLIAARFPRSSSTVLSEFIGYLWALLAISILLCFCSKALSICVCSWRRALRLFVGGATFLACPAMVLSIRLNGSDTTGFTIAMALTPIVISIGLCSQSTSNLDDIGVSIWPSLAAVAGLLMLFSQPTLGNISTDVMYVLEPLLTGLGAVFYWVHRNGIVSSKVLALITTGTVLATVLEQSKVHGYLSAPISFLAIFLDGFCALLGILSLLQLGPVRWSAQYSIVPLLIALQGVVLFQIRLSVHLIAGLFLLLASSAGILWKRSTEQNRCSFTSEIK